MSITSESGFAVRSPRTAPNARLPVSLHREIVEIAIERCGGKKRLAAVLNVSVDEITSWAEGHTQAPDAILLRILVLLSGGGDDASR